jgi:hypothetical protein
METVNIINDFDPKEYNLLIPVQSLQEINPIFKYVRNEVLISTVLQDKEIYHESSAQVKDGPKMYALTHKALMKLCNAGNGQIVEVKKIQPRVCEKCIEVARATGIAPKCVGCEARYNVAAHVTMKFPELSGGWKIIQASREVDLSTIAKSGQADKLKEFAGEHAESKAISRVIRKAFAIKSAYTLEELKKPFIAVYPVLNANDPDAKRALIAGSMAASNLLYGSGLTLGAPEEVKQIETSTDNTTNVPADDYVVEPLDPKEHAETGTQSNNEEPEKFFCGNPDCGIEIKANVAEYSTKRYKMPLCVKCQGIAEKKKKEKEAAKA